MKLVLRSLLEKKLIRSALFLEATPSSVFSAYASVNAQAKRSLWKGLQWDPQIFPNEWKTLQEKGLIEFRSNDQNTNRSAFGVDGLSWLTMIRIGTPNNFLGILILTSPESLALALTKVFAHFAIVDRPREKKAA